MLLPTPHGRLSWLAATQKDPDTEEHKLHSLLSMKFKDRQNQPLAIEIGRGFPKGVGGSDRQKHQGPFGSQLELSSGGCLHS